jgi:hypothetical protein
MTSIASMKNPEFKLKLQKLMAEYNLGIQDTTDLTGEELDEATSNNDGMYQLYDAIVELHQEFIALAAKPAPKKRAPAKKKAATASDSEAEVDGEAAPAPEKKKSAAAKKTEATDDEAAPEKKKRAPSKKKAAADGEPAEPKAPTAYNIFTSEISKIIKNKDEPSGDVMVTVSLEKVTDACQVLLEHEAAKTLLAMKGKEYTVKDIVKVCSDLLTIVDKKVAPFKRTSLIWAAVGNKSPF